jgi:hypothetical protein
VKIYDSKAFVASGSRHRTDIDPGAHGLIS